MSSGLEQGLLAVVRFFFFSLAVVIALSGIPWQAADRLSPVSSGQKSNLGNLWDSSGWKRSELCTPRKRVFLRFFWVGLLGFPAFGVRKYRNSDRYWPRKPEKRWKTRGIRADWGFFSLLENISNFSKDPKSVVEQLPKHPGA